MSTRLLQQIKEEMQREAEIEKRIENMKKRILKRQEYKKYRVIPTRKDADAVIVFDHENLPKYNFIVYKENGYYLNDFENNHSATIVYLKNKNPRDAKSSTIGHVLKSNP